MKGFTVIELIVALGVVLLIAGALAAAARPAREAFDRVPAELDLEQRARTAMDALASPLRSSLTAEVSEDGTAVTTLVRVPQGGQGTLAADQATASAPLALSTFACPNIKDVCGLTVGNTVLILGALDDNSDVFTVAAVSAGARTLTPNRALSCAYRRNSIIVAVDQYTFRLALQGDGSYSLIRETFAGAVQPIVDFVSDLTFTAQSGRVDISLRVHPPPGSSIAPRDFTSSVLVRNAS